MNRSFLELGLDEVLVEALKKENITTPTPIQELTIQKMLNKEDFIAQAETGSGKTLAYLLPLFMRLQPVVAEQQVLILVPTHELAIQVNAQIESLRKNSNILIKGASIIGNASIDRQIEKLKEKPQIIIGSPGRVIELIKRKKIKAHTIKTIIIDEADKMLDRNNIDQVKAVIKTTLKERHVALFSASMNAQTIEKAKEFMKTPEIVKSSVRNTIPPSIEHIYFICEQREKPDMIRKIARILNPSKAIVFINKADDIELATEKLVFHKFKAKFIHGTSDKIERRNAIEAFKFDKIQLLVGTDMAARGLHFDNVTAIFNVSMPEDATNYLHRAGRTGRNGKDGLVISIITKEELELIKRYESEFKIKITGKQMYQGKIYDLEKQGE